VFLSQQRIHSIESPFFLVYGQSSLHLHVRRTKYPLFSNYRGAGKSLARPGRKQATGTKPTEMSNTPR
jgi:hypothetical protein